MILQKLLTIVSRHGRPGTLLSVGHSSGKLLYVEAGMGPVSVVAALERDDVEQLVGALADWLVETDPAGAYAGPAAGAPLVGGAIARTLRDARTVQLCTVPAAEQGVHN